MSMPEGSSPNFVFRPIFYGHIWVIKIEPIEFLKGLFHFYSEFLTFFLIFDLNMGQFTIFRYGWSDNSG